MSFQDEKEKEEIKKKEEGPASFNFSVLSFHFPENPVLSKNKKHPLSPSKEGRTVQETTESTFIDRVNGPFPVPLEEEIPVVCYIIVIWSSFLCSSLRLKVKREDEGNDDDVYFCTSLRSSRRG